MSRLLALLAAYPLQVNRVQSRSGPQFHSRAAVRLPFSTLPFLIYSRCSSLASCSKPRWPVPQVRHIFKLVLNPLYSAGSDDFGGAQPAPIVADVHAQSAQVPIEPGSKHGSVQWSVDITLNRAVPAPPRSSTSSSKRSLWDSTCFRRCSPTISFLVRCLRAQCSYFSLYSLLLVFVACVLCLAFDFWTVKNVTGRSATPSSVACFDVFVAVCQLAGWPAVVE